MTFNNTHTHIRSQFSRLLLSHNHHTVSRGERKQPPLIWSERETYVNFKVNHNKITGRNSGANRNSVASVCSHCSQQSHMVSASKFGFLCCANAYRRAHAAHRRCHYSDSDFHSNLMDHRNDSLRCRCSAVFNDFFSLFPRGPSVLRSFLSLLLVAICICGCPMNGEWTAFVSQQWQIASLMRGPRAYGRIVELMRLLYFR